MHKTQRLMAVCLAMGFAAAAFAETSDKTPATDAPPQQAMPPLALPPGGPMMQPGKAMPFPSPGAIGATNISPDTLRKVMQSRSELDDLTRQLQARQAYLYDEDPRIKERQSQMRAIQEEIEAILAKDEELKTLRAKLDGMFNAPMPMPGHIAPGAPATPDAAKGATDKKQD